MLFFVATYSMIKSMTRHCNWIGTNRPLKNKIFIGSILRDVKDQRSLQSVDSSHWIWKLRSRYIYRVCYYTIAVSLTSKFIIPDRFIRKFIHLQCCSEWWLTECTFGNLWKELAVFLTDFCFIFVLLTLFVTKISKKSASRKHECQSKNWNCENKVLLEEQLKWNTVCFLVNFTLFSNRKRLSLTYWNRIFQYLHLNGCFSVSGIDNGDIPFKKSYFCAL